MSENLNALEKAQVLIEALPYIQRFNRKIIVVKYGGSAMVDEKLKKQVIQDVTLLKLVGFKPIIVHGGGKEISKWVAKAGMEPEFINGLRKTDAPTMEIAEMVLNRVNKSLVSMVQELGVQAVGISGKDGGLLKVEKKLSDGQDIGYVGEVKEVNPKILYDLLEKDFLPIICPIGLDDNYDTYNINADDAACAARLSDKLGGGSLTALPIIETQAGDVSAYIPTNVISITDGQIYLETEMFNAGFRPAINAGLSVSRVGGAAQIKAMKKIAAPIRTELAQYRELAAFAQFGSELDADTSEKLAQGERLKEILKQPQYQPMPVAKQIVIIYAAVKKYLMDIPVEKILHFQDALLELIDTRYPEITGKITETQVIDEETEQKLIAAIQETKKEYLA